MTDQFTDSREYQIKLLAYMLSNHDFCSIASDCLQGQHFSDKALQWFFDTLASAEIKLTAASLQQEMVKAVKSKQIRQDEIDKYIEYYDFIKIKPLPVEEEHINKELGVFIRTQATKKAVNEVWPLIKSESWDEIIDKLTTAVNSGLDVLELGDFYFNTHSQRIADRSAEVSLPKLSTGIPELDDLMYGGLKPKQMGLIAGGTGRGKSVFLLWLARVAVLLGKKVIYYTFELSKEDIAERFDSLFSRVKINELKVYDTKVYNSLSGMAPKFGDRLVIKEYPADAATVNTMKAHLRQLSGVGFIPDLIIVDYLDLLKPHRTYNSQTEELDAITKALRGLTVEHNTRMWAATQLNRSGMAMETPDETAIAGAVAKLFTVDVSIFMAQTKEEREDELMRLSIVKNRNGPAGRTIKLDTDYSHMTFYRSPIVASHEQEAGTDLVSKPVVEFPTQPVEDPEEPVDMSPEGVIETDDGTFILE